MAFKYQQGSHPEDAVAVSRLPTAGGINRGIIAANKVIHQQGDSNGKSQVEI
ncbi:3729_t:CDS:2 [Gigaspora rosea]|nr:3729_t:CDS:2 [Gigaspora rosea]